MYSSDTSEFQSEVKGQQTLELWGEGSPGRGLAIGEELEEE